MQKKKSKKLEQNFLQVKIPHDWRLGQFLFNFQEWLREAREYPVNQSFRLADLFHVPDEELRKELQEFLVFLKETE